MLKNPAYLLAALPYVLTFAFVGVLLLVQSSANPNLPGNVDNDNTVGHTDMSILLSNWHRTGSPSPLGDVDGSGRVDLIDFSIQLTNWDLGYEVARD